MPEAEIRAAYSAPVSLSTQGQSRYPLQAGTGRCIVIEDWDQEPLYINFGASSVVANPGQGFMMNYGKSQYVIPDGATHMALHTDSGHPVVAHFGMVEKPEAQVSQTQAPSTDADSLADLLDPDV